MTALSSKKFKNIDVGATVLVEVPKVDRGPLDSKNAVGKVIDKGNELYKVGTFGVINDWLPQNAVLPNPGEILPDDLPEAKLPLKKYLRIFCIWWARNEAMQLQKIFQGTMFI
ncbi:unnamed protein product [Parnassius apollo]|uniref:(apollo) hypothetical protein n=1 Tax=Parnassius apollo TaxID=110799 RepID=A0A8S3XWH0_PARAO|nr:unnamed protein product [Parnassius apollo]